MLNNLSIKNKHRPTKFMDMKGCDASRKSFMSILKNTDSESFILTGPRGTGKTTFSRLMAKSIIKKYNANPNAIKEINVSNETGVDFARGIIDGCSYISFHGCSVYILNEVQMASTQWQNAMLDILEKPPEKTFFILCTTQENKLDKAVLSRCTKFVFKPLNKKDCFSLIEDIQEKEDFVLEEDQKDEIFRASFGIPREILNILGVIKNLSQEEIHDYIRNYTVQDEETEEIKNLTKELISMSSMEKALNILDSLQDNPETIRLSVLNYFYRIMIKPYGSEKQKKDSRLKASIIIDCFKDSVIYTGKAGLALAIYNYYS